MKKHNYAWMLFGAFVGFLISVLIVQNFEFLGVALFVPIGILAGFLASLLFGHIKAAFAKYSLSLLLFAVLSAILYFVEFTIIGYYLLS